ncbi:DNA-processing protein DprA [Microcella flavibacter]|uniref:DNA-processing protein DprA n=1 Tax=Microcella flavibacter TaxID=1804990 RepID=UPI001E442929|nr:DNA-processing protein DprA [Microcella flavibacter]
MTMTETDVPMALEGLGDAVTPAPIRWGIADAVIDAALAAVGRAPRDRAARDEAFARVVWSVLVEPGDATAGALIRHCGAADALRVLLDRRPASALVEATEGEIAPRAAGEARARWIPRLRSDDVLRALASAARCDARLLLPQDALWPSGLDDLGDSAPVVLWVRGDPIALRRPGIAVVGARAATGYGEHVAMELSAGLVGRGAAVISGGAYGIDGMAHRAALASGGTTVAVLAGGIDRFYPSGHEALLQRIVQSGAVVTEAPCGSAPTKWRFLQRNRVIAALARATVVVEAGRRSGALNTAHHALDLGREVGAVPGPVTSAASAGCHRLLREHPAVCITGSADAMVLAFGMDGVIPDDDPVDEDGAAGRSARGPLTPDGGIERGEEDAAAPREDPIVTRVADALRPQRRQTAEELARAAGVSVETVRGALGILALEERAIGDDLGRWRRAPVPRRKRSEAERAASPTEDEPSTEADGAGPPGDGGAE